MFGVYLTEHVEVLLPPAPRLSAHLLGAVKVLPEAALKRVVFPFQLNVTVPEGSGLPCPAPEPFTDAVHIVTIFTATGLGMHEIVVVEVAASVNVFCA